MLDLTNYVCRLVLRKVLSVPSVEAGLILRVGHLAILDTSYLLLGSQEVLLGRDGLQLAELGACHTRLLEIGLFFLCILGQFQVHLH